MCLGFKRLPYPNSMVIFVANILFIFFELTLTLNSKVAIITSDQDTFVEFLYPSNGLNWLQGDFGESGLPDIRAQSGFVAEDGRYFTLSGSGTDNVSVFFEKEKKEKI